jgi:hypothetical protein
MRKPINLDTTLGTAKIITHLKEVVQNDDILSWNRKTTCGVVDYSATEYDLPKTPLARLIKHQGKRYEADL